MNTKLNSLATQLAELTLLMGKSGYGDGNGYFSRSNGVIGYNHGRKRDSVANCGYRHRAGRNKENCWKKA